MSKNKRLKMLAAALMVGSLYLTPGMQNPVMPVGMSSALAAEPSASATSGSQYVAIYGGVANKGDSKLIDDQTYIFQTSNGANWGEGYWVREGYTITVTNNEDDKYTPLSKNGQRVDVQYIGEGNPPEEILSSIQSTEVATGTSTNLNESLQKIDAGTYSGATNALGTEINPTWDYIIEDSSWKDSVIDKNYKDGYVNLTDLKGPKGFVTTESPDSKLKWDEKLQSYTYDGQRVDYSNLYVIGGKTGVFTNKEGSEIYKGTVYGLHNEVLTTVQKDGKLYSYWAAKVTDPKLTMETYRVSDYLSDLKTLSDNDEKLARNDIKEVRMTKSADGNSATFQLYRNGVDENGNNVAVDGAMTFSAGGGTGGNDTYVQVSDGTDDNTVTLATGSKVSVSQNPTNKTTTVNVNGNDYVITDTNTYVTKGTVITKDGKTVLSLTRSDNTTVPDIDLSAIKGTTYTAGKGITISEDGKNAISVKVPEKGNLEVTDDGVVLKSDVTNINSVNGFDIVTGISGENNTNGMNINIHNDKDGITVNGVNIKQDTVSSLSNTTWDSSKDYSQSTKAATEAQLQQVSSVAQNANKGWYLSTNDGEKVNVKPDGVVDISNTDGNVAIKNDGTNVTVDLNDKVTLGNEDGINVAIDGTKGTLEVNGISSTTKIEGDRITVGKDVTIDGGSQPSISVGGIKADGYTDVVTGLSNTKWNNQIAGKVKADETEQSKAATQGQLSSVWDKANEAGTEAAKHTTVTVNGGTEAEEGTYNADGNLQIKKTDNNGQTAYDVKLNDKVTLGNEDGINVAIDGTKGTLEVNGISSTTKIEGDRITVGKDVTIDGGSQPSISVGGIKADGYTDVVTGLSNTKWNNQIAGKVKADETEQSKAATQGQLSSVWDKANEAGTEAAKHTTVTVNGGTEAEEGTYNADGNLQIKKTDNNGQTAYDVKLNDKVTLGNEDGINVAIDGTKGTLEVNGISSTTKIEGDRITVGKDVTIDGGSQPSISVGGIKADGYTDVVTGLSNTKWNNQIAGKVKADETEQSKAATQGQLSSVWDKANEAGTEAAKHTTVTVNGGTEAEEGTYNADGNLQIKKTDNNGQTAYDVKLNDKVTLGNEDGINVAIDGTKGTLEVNGISSTTKIEGDRITVGKDVTIDGGSQPSISVGGIKADGYTDVVTGLSNTKWNNQIAGKVKADETEQSKAATQGQLSSVWDKANEAGAEAAKHTTLSDGKNTTVSSTTVNGQTDYQVNLKDQITLGSSDNPGSITIAGADDKKPITIANNLVIGLANVDWTEAIKNNVANSDKEKSKAATQGQLSDLNDYIDTLDEGNVKYNVNADGSIDYENITLGKIAYESETRSGGTHLNNVAYATGKDGSEAVNVDYLNDKIAESAGSGAVAENEKHIDTSKEYTVENNTVKLDEVNGQGNPTGNQVVINDVASAKDLADLKDNVGDLNYSTVEGTEIKDGESTTTAIGKLDNKVDSLGDKVTNIEGNAITNGNITENGDINLKNDKGETQATVSGLTDSSLSDAKYDASKGELTLTTKDKYGNDANKNFTVGNIASKDDIKNINTVTGADSKENLQEQYKDTNFIKDADNMVDADKKLDQAVSDNRDAIINNANNISNLDRRVSDLDSRVNKVGALAVAMAGLHPLGYDPSAPTEFSAAVGNYKGETALAIGVFHHPNEDVLLSVGASIAGDETAVNAGATFRFGRRGHNPQEEAERKAREEAKLAAQKAAQEEAYRKTMQYKIQKALTYQDNSEAVSESTTEAKDASGDTQEFPNVDLDAQNANSEANA